MPGSNVAHLTISAPPPSVNAMYTPIAKGRSILSKEGRAWKAMALGEIFGQRGIGSVPRYWSLFVQIPGKGTRCDLPNYEKALTDILVTAEKVPDDRYLVDYRFRFYGGETIEITISREDLSVWSKIRHASKALIRKMTHD